MKVEFETTPRDLDVFIEALKEHSKRQDMDSPRGQYDACLCDVAIIGFEERLLEEQEPERSENRE